MKKEIIFKIIRKPLVLKITSPTFHRKIAKRLLFISTLTKSYEEQNNEYLKCNYFLFGLCIKLKSRKFVRSHEILIVVICLCLNK